MFTIGLVGATNAGKSLLFNKLLGTYRAIVTDIPGTTRELLRENTRLDGYDIQLIDSPGLLDFHEEMTFIDQIIKEAELLVFVVDGKQEPTSKEQEIHELICRAGKFDNTILVVNKLDSKVYTKDRDLLVSPWYMFGYALTIPCSAIQDEGIDLLEDAILEHLKAETTTGKGSPEDDVSVHLAIVGRPNAGKSTLLNKLVGEEISFVAPTPGTTLDYLSATFSRKGKQIKLYDTAGIRKKGKTHGLERIAYEKTKSLLGFIHPVTILLVDLEEGLTQRDATLLQECVDWQVPLIVAVNKIDLYEKNESDHKIKQLQQAVRLPARVPIVSISGQHAIGLPKMMETVIQVQRARIQRVDTAELNKVVMTEWLTRPPRFPKNKICKRKYITQVKHSPPTFVISVNRKDYANFSFQSWLENGIRKGFGFIGCPIVLEFREKTGENPYA